MDSTNADLISKTYAYCLIITFFNVFLVPITSRPILNTWSLICAACCRHYKRFNQRLWLLAFPGKRVKSLEMVQPVATTGCPICHGIWVGGGADRKG